MTRRNALTIGLAMLVSITLSLFTGCNYFSKKAAAKTTAVSAETAPTPAVQVSNAPLPESAPNTYRIHGFVLAVPVGWVERDYGGLRMLVDPSPSKFAPNLNVMIERLPSDMKLSDVMDVTQTQLKQIMNATIVDRRDARSTTMPELAGLAATTRPEATTRPDAKIAVAATQPERPARLEAVYEVGGSKLHLVQYYFVRDGKIYYLTGTTESSKWGRYVAIFDEVAALAKFE